MNFRKLFFIFAALIIGLSSCDNEDELDPTIIVGSWQYSNIERFVIDTNKDSLTAAIKYIEIALRVDSTIYEFKDESILCITNKDFSDYVCSYKYSFDGKNKLSIIKPDDDIEVQQFAVIGNIAIYKTGPSSKISYTNKDGSFNEEAFNMLVKEYPKTMEGLVFKELKIYNIYFFELFKRQMIYY